MTTPIQSVSRFCAINLFLAIPFLMQAQIAALPGSSASSSHLSNALVTEIGTNQASITVKDCPKGDCTTRPQQIVVDEAGLKADLKDFKIGDHVALDYSEKDKKATLQAITVVLTEVSRLSITWRLLTLAGVFLLFAWLVSGGHPLRLTVIGADNRYSNSKFQLAIWLWVLFATYLTTVWLRVHLAGWEFYKIGIPQNLLLLSGLSALTYAGAKGITTEKVKEDKQAQAQAAQAAGSSAAVAVDRKFQPEGRESFLKNLFQNDAGQFDLGDFQMILVTLIAIVMYLTLIYHFVGDFELRKAATLPDVDTTILAAFGLGQGAYLAKKAAGDVAKA